MVAIWLMLATVIGVVIGWILGSRGTLSDRIVVSSPVHSPDKGPGLETLMAEIASLKAGMAGSEQGTQQVRADQLGTYEAEISALRGRVHELESQPVVEEEIPLSDLQTDLLDLPDMAPIDQARLISKGGIQSQSQLFEQVKSVAPRINLATKTGIDVHRLLWWANLMDIQRLRGLTIVLAHYLSAAGAGSLSELARKRPHQFYPQLRQVMEVDGHLDDCPTEQTLHAWIEEAKTLPRRVQ